MTKRKRELHHILDTERRLKYWPSRLHLRLEALTYLASKLRDDQTYTEASMNALIRYWCVFDDPALMRRELYDRRFVGRTPDGSRYWLLPVQQIVTGT